MNIRQLTARCFSGESKGSARANAFSLQADKEGRPLLALLFRVLSNAKGVHARRFGHLMRGKIGTTDENLQEALENEKTLHEEYKAIALEIKNENVSGAVRKGFLQSKRTVEEYIEILSGAVDGIHPPEDSRYYVCQICGHIHKDSVPANCPVCGAVPGRFQRVV